MKILVFESEIYSYHQIRTIVEDYDAQNEVIGPFTSTEHAREYLTEHAADVDIIISETVLTDGDVFGVLDSMPRRVPVIFITSHKEHAFKAFSYLSLSYLLKPVDGDALTEALARAVRLHKAASMLTPTGGWTKNSDGVTRIAVKKLHGERIVHVSTIRYIVSEQKTTYVKLLDGNSYRIDKPLEQVESMLGGGFMRVNRKFILPLEQVAGTERIENGKLLLLLKGNNPPKVVVSRTRKVEVCKWLRSE